MSDEPGLFCVVMGAAFSAVGLIVGEVDRGTGALCIAIGALLVALGVVMIADLIPSRERRHHWIEHDAMYGPHMERETWWTWRGRIYRKRSTIVR